MFSMLRASVASGSTSVVLSRDDDLCVDGRRYSNCDSGTRCEVENRKDRGEAKCVQPTIERRIARRNYPTPGLVQVDTAGRNDRSLVDENRFPHRSARRVCTLRAKTRS